MKTYQVCDTKGNVQPKVAPKRMTEKQANQENRDFHIRGLSMAWIESRRIKDGKVALMPNGKTVEEWGKPQPR